MAYKFKPNKSVAKRFKVSKTGKLKRGHSLTSHLMSARDSNKKRRLGRTAILFEGHAKNMRDMMGVRRLRPKQIAHLRALRAQQELKAAQAGESSPAGENSPDGDVVEAGKGSTVGDRQGNKLVAAVSSVATAVPKTEKPKRVVKKPSEPSKKAGASPARD